MIIKELNEYFQRLVEDPNSDVAPRFWSKEKVSWVIDINKEGQIVHTTPLITGEGKKEQQFKLVTVPEHGGRSGSGTIPFFLCDNAAYLLGYNDKRGEEKLAASKALVKEVVDSLEDDGLKAILKYFERSDRDALLSQEQRDILWEEKKFLVFRLEGDSGYLHDRPMIKKAWETFSAKPKEGAIIGQCSISGETSSLTRLFPQVTGFPGAQSAGASLVSFNSNAYESYGKSQAYNASISEGIAAGAGAALKYLCSQPDHKVRLGDTLVVFWADRAATEESQIVQAMMNPPQNLSLNMDSYFDEEEIPKDKTAESKAQLQLITKAFQDMQKGKPLDGFDTETRFFILGLAPNAARLSVRFFETSTFGELTARYGQYLHDVAMVNVKAFSPRMLLLQTATLGKAENIPSTLVSSFMRAIIKGTFFPESVFSLVLSRMRADRATNNTWDMGQRAALLKACSNRKARLKSEGANKDNKEVFRVSLDRNQKSEGYVLGRLFAVMEHTQKLAIGDANATIRDRYMGAAAVTPARVFPQLLRNLQNHIGKIRKDPAAKGRAIWLDKETQEILDILPGFSGFSATLSPDEQAAFYVGYYQQTREFYKKTTEDNTEAKTSQPSATSSDE